MENDATSISAFSNVVNNIIWTFKDLGYQDDLRAASNVRGQLYKSLVNFNYS